jgi:hypothetical protein
VSGKIPKKREKLDTRSGRLQSLSRVEIKQQKFQRNWDDRTMSIDVTASEMNSR